MNFENFSSEAMEQLLSRLGFRLFASRGPQRVFENPEYHAVLLLPPAGKEAYTRPEHLMTLRRAVVERDIMDESAFDELVNELRQQPVETLAKAS